jgi:hypothetical protein
VETHDGVGVRWPAELVRPGSHRAGVRLRKTHTVWTVEIHADEIMYGAREQRNREERAPAGRGSLDARAAGCGPHRVGPESPWA